MWKRNAFRPKSPNEPDGTENAQGLNQLGGIVHRVSRFSAVRDSGCASRIGVRRYRARLEGISDDVRTCVVSDVWCTSLEIGYIASDLQAIGLAGANLENVIRLPVSEKPRCWSA